MRIVLFRQVVLLAVLLNLACVQAQGGDKDDPKVMKLEPVLNQTNPTIIVAPNKIETFDAVCKKFAADSVVHNDWQVKQKCGYVGNEWSSDPQYHYDRCIKSQIQKDEYLKRQASIADCICTPYAKDAVKQNNENINYQCGYVGSRWVSDEAHHFNWCARGGGAIIETGSWKSFSDAREIELTECKKPTSPTNLHPSGGVFKNSDVTVTWKDPAKGKPNAATMCQVEFYVNGKKHGPQNKSSNKFIIDKKFLNYSANVIWKVRGENDAGKSLWSKAAFSIEKKPTPPPTPTGGINGTFFFDGSQGTEQFTITVKFTGKFISGSGTSGKKSFSVTKTKTMYPSSNATVSFSQSGLAKGKWDISASSNMTGPVTCKATVPGFVKLDVTGGPSCN